LRELPLKFKTMKKIILLISFLIIGTTVHAQWWNRTKGNGNMITQTRNTSDYEQLNVAGFFDVVLVKGTEGKISLKGEENLLEYIEVSVTNKVLTIKIKENTNLSTSWNKSITVRVPIEEIEGVKLSGSGDISAEFTLESPFFEAIISGSGVIDLNIDTQKLTAKVSGSGDLDLSGKARDLDIKVSGSGDINASKLEALNANVVVSGSADVQVSVSGILDAKVSGSGDVHYKGNPKKVSTKVSGSGDISKY
jgi:hypothetical protein